MTSILGRTRAALVLALTLAACGNSARPGPAAEGATVVPSTSTPAASAPAVASAPPAAASSAAPDAGAAPQSATADASAVVDAGPPPEVADNKVSPTEGPELQERARGLFDAIVKNEPERAEAFWFPRAPFVPLKDVKDPGKYWDQLHRAYVNDVHALHKKRKSWDGAEFVSFEGWARTKWVKPGDEANKIGYYRAFHGKLRYKVGGEDASIDVHTIITWQGRWFITHLRKFKK